MRATAAFRRPNPMAVEMITAPAVKEIESGADYGKFEIEPLEPGFGVTLGNSLRRVLLSSLPGQAIGVITIDAIFTPVRKANFSVEKTRVGQETEWDKLIVEVWTDGTLAPVEAVSRAAGLFTEHLDLFVRFGDNLAAPQRSQTR